MGVIPPDTPGVDVEVSNDSGNPLDVNIVNTLPSTQAAIVNGLAGGVLSGADANVASVVAGANGLLLHGIVATGDGDAQFTLLENLAPKMRGRTNGADKNWIVSLDVPIFFAAGSSILLDVNNQSASTADYYGTIVYEQV